MASAGLTWTKERIERLKELWTEGLSASQIEATENPRSGDNLPCLVVSYGANGTWIWCLGTFQAI